MRKMFLEKSSKKYGGEASSRPASKKSKLSISLDQLPEMVYSFFIDCILLSCHVRVSEFCLNVKNSLLVVLSPKVEVYQKIKVLTNCFDLI